MAVLRRAWFNLDLAGPSALHRRGRLRRVRLTPPGQVNRPDTGDVPDMRTTRTPPTSRTREPPEAAAYVAQACADCYPHCWPSPPSSACAMSKPSLITAKGVQRLVPTKRSRRPYAA
ncbi:hypothetical protein GCM10017559_64520 [Streptosporangium longisporum]|uniref:Uncharacterized protein n=1 Tax=Streptosporangium longisporum TaxID=46187 RepID=A0ABP6L135_9ACTN